MIVTDYPNGISIVDHGDTSGVMDYTRFEPLMNDEESPWFPGTKKQHINVIDKYLRSKFLNSLLEQTMT